MTTGAALDARGYDGGRENYLELGDAAIYAPLRTVVWMDGEYTGDKPGVGDRNTVVILISGDEL